MRDFCICVLSFCIIVLTIGHCIQEYNIADMKQTLKRVEYGYQAVVAENEQLRRINEQNLRLMAEGGW